MFDNAKQYNAEGSDVYLDAEELQQLFWKSIGKNGRGRQSKGKRPRKHENELQEVFHNGEIFKVGTDYSMFGIEIHHGSVDVLLPHRTNCSFLFQCNAIR